MLAVLAALALALLPRLAGAAPLVNKGVFASGVAAYPMYLSKAYTYSFRAWATAGGTDPVIHIWDPVIKAEVGWADDSPDMGLNSRIPAFNPKADRTYYVISHSYWSTSTGDGRLEYCINNPSEPTRCNEQPTPAAEPMVPSNWSPVGPALVQPLRGTQFDYAPGQTNLSYQTAKVNEQLGGVRDTVLLVVTNSRHITAFSDDDGVGLMSNTGATNGALVVLGGYNSEGLTNLYGNDVTVPRDWDGDGLGRDLEYELGTCDTPYPSYFTPGWAYCADRTAKQVYDTDMDGLNDGIEVLGFEPPGDFAQELPAWGADPLRKDMFVEQDFVLKSECPAAGGLECWHSTSVANLGQNPFTEAMAVQFADVVQIQLRHDFMIKLLSEAA